MTKRTSYSPKSRKPKKTKVRKGFIYALGTTLLAGILAFPFVYAPYIEKEPHNFVHITCLLSPEDDYATSVSEAAHSVLKITMEFNVTRTISRAPTVDPETGETTPNEPFIIPDRYRAYGSGTVVSCQLVTPAVTETTVNADGEEETVIVARAVYRLLLLTAAHVTDIPNFHPNITLVNLNILATHRDNDFSLEDGAVISEHPYKDLSLISFLSDTPIKAVKIAEQKPELAQPLTVIGFGGQSGTRGSQWISRGLASDIDRVTCSVAPGDSGGAILNAQARLVGVVSQIEVNRNSWSPFAEALNHHCLMVPTYPSVVMDWVTETVLDSHKTSHPKAETTENTDTLNKTPQSSSTGPKEPKAPLESPYYTPGPMGPGY